MNKSQLLDHMAQSSDLTKAKAEVALSAMIKGISDALSNGDEVALVGFGTFKVNERVARTGRNPRTGEEIQIAAAKVPTFRASKALKEAVNS